LLQNGAISRPENEKAAVLAAADGNPQICTERIIARTAERVKGILRKDLGKTLVRGELIGAWPTCTAGPLAITGPSSQGGNTLRTVRSCNNLQAGKRLLVRGVAARPDAGRRRKVLVPQLSGGQNRSVAEVRQNRRSMKLQSI
jgi:hypothetical protein